jgi:hypothetical protein
MSFDNTQLTSAFGYDVNNMRFRKPVDGSILNDTVKFKRIAIGTRNPDGTLGELVIPTLQVYSFGLSENVNPQSMKTDGYSLSLCLYSKDNASDEQKKWVETFNAVVEHVKKYLLDHKDDIEKYELEPADLKKLNPLYYKKDKGKIVEGTGPTLYAKVMQNKKNNSITTPFCDENGNDLDPLSLLGKRCYATAAIKFEGVFIGSRISLQVKVYEAKVKLIDSAPRRFLQSMASNPNVVFDEKSEEKSTQPSQSSQPSQSHVDDDSGSLNGDSESDDDKPQQSLMSSQSSQPTQSQTQPKAPVRRTQNRKP